MPTISIAEAAARFNVSIDTIRRRVRSGALSAKRDARGQWWLEVPNAPPEPRPPSVGERLAVGIAAPLQAGGDPDVVTLLRDQIADLRARLDASEAERREEVARAASERERLLAMIQGMVGAKK